MKPQRINGKFYSYIIKYKDNNDIRLKHYFAENLKDLFETIETWKKVFCIYQDNIISIEQVMEPVDQPTYLIDNKRSCEL